MRRSVLRSALIVGICSTLLSATQLSNAAIILNYQFEDSPGFAGTAPNQTVVDSSGNFSSSAASPFRNALFGTGAGSTPGTDYPMQLNGAGLGPTGYVSNATVGSLNMTNAIGLYNNTATNGNRIRIDDAATSTGSIPGGSLDQTFSNLTISLWLNPGTITTPRDAYIMSKVTTGSNRGFQMYRLSGTNNLGIDYWPTNANANIRTLVYTDVLPQDTWTQLTFTFAPGSDNLYVNNVLTAPSTATGTIPNTLNFSNSQPFEVGYRNSAANTGWVGGIDDVRIFNEALASTPTGSPDGTGSLLLAVPEPSTYAIAAMGLVGLVMLRRRK